MKIIHLVEAWKGGIATYCYSLICAQAAEGHEVILVADEGLYLSDPREMPCRVVFYKSTRNPLFFWTVFSSVRSIVSRISADVIHIHSTFPGVYARLRRLPVRRVLYMPHGWSFFRKNASFPVRIIYKTIERRLSLNTDIIICMSIEEVRAARLAGIPSSLLRLVHTGISEKSISIGKTKINCERNINVGFFGRLSYQKGADILRDIGPLLNDNITLHVYGSSASREDFSINSHPKVISHGWIPHDSLSLEMAEMDAIIMPSRWEGFSLVALEALRDGVALIISNETSLSEILVDGFNGLIMRDYSLDGLVELINGLSIDDCRRMGSNGRLVYEEVFTFRKYYEKIMRLYS